MSFNKFPGALVLACTFPALKSRGAETTPHCPPVFSAIRGTSRAPATSSSAAMPTFRQVAGASAAGRAVGNSFVADLKGQQTFACIEPFACAAGLGSIAGTVEQALINLLKNAHEAKRCRSGRWKLHIVLLRGCSTY